MSQKRLIWVVDDDLDIRKLLDEYLSANGYDVRCFANASDVEKWLHRLRPDLLVLDLMLRGMSGIELCQRLRAMDDDIPIIMLTARSDPTDRILGFEAGADDYLPKPFVPRELTARIEAVLRRRTPKPIGTPEPNGNILEFGRCQLDLATRTFYRDGQSVDITTGEFALLTVLVKHPHQPFSRERLLEMARGRDSKSDERSIDVQVSRLRKLIEPAGGSPKHIQTVWGLGYVFVPDTPEELP